MNIVNAVLSVLCLVGHVMSQETHDTFEAIDQYTEEGRFYRSQFDRGSGGSIGRGGRSRTAEFFNSNLQLDNVAQFRGSSSGRSLGSSSRGFGGSQRRGRGIQEDPMFIRRILGSTVLGREMRMGERDLPRHGGAGIGEQYADGRNGGWDGNPQTLTTQYQSSWSDPFQGQPIPQLPIGFNGDFGSVRGMFGSRGLPPFRVPGQFLCYRGRQRKPKVIPKKQPLQVGGFDHMTDPFGNGLNSLRGGGIMGMPDDIKQILGSTITGEAMVGGMNGLPRHGGTLNADGIVNGWGANANSPVIPAVQMWNDPLNGAAFPVDYRGEELIFDQRLNRYVKRPVASVGHQIEKEAHVGVKTGGIIAGGVPTGHNTVKAEHNIVKQANHVERKTLGGAIGGIGSPIGVDPFSHNIDKQILPGAGDATVGLIGATVNKLGGINVGDIAVDDPRVIAHNIGVATLGADAVAGHNIAESSGLPVIRGFINRNGHFANQMKHNVAKTSGVGAADPFGVGIDPFGQATHGNMKISSGRHIGVSSLGPIDIGFGANPVAGMRPVGVMGKTADSVHNVDKVGQSGLAGIGHDPLAASLGHGIAKKAMGEAANVINMGTRGGLVAGDPIAIAAKNGLVRDSLAVADRTIALASSGVAGHSGFGAGVGIFGQNAMIHPKPVKKPPPKFPTGYRGRQRH